MDPCGLIQINDGGGGEMTLKVTFSCLKGL